MIKFRWRPKFWPTEHNDAFKIAPYQSYVKVRRAVSWGYWTFYIITWGQEQ